MLGLGVDLLAAIVLIIYTWAKRYLKYYNSILTSGIGINSIKNIGFIYYLQVNNINNYSI